MTWRALTRVPAKFNSFKCGCLKNTRISFNKKLLDRLSVASEDILAISATSWFVNRFELISKIFNNLFYLSADNVSLVIRVGIALMVNCLSEVLRAKSAITFSDKGFMPIFNDSSMGKEVR